MDNPQNIVCCGCLSIGRKMIKIDLERKDCFYQILGDLQTVADFKLMYLCWECTGRLSNYIKFKSQVRYAHKCLQDIEKDLKLVSQSKLNTQNTLIINYDPETSEELDWHIAASEEKETPSDQQFSETETVVQPKKKIKKASKSKRVMHLYKEIELTESDIEAERDTEASSDSFVNALFKCEKCVEAFPNQEDLNDHNLKKHNKRLRFSCLVCECYFGTAAALSYHANKHRIRYQCRSCDKKFLWRGNLLRHMKSHQARANGNLVCVPCNRKFSSIATFKQHMKMSMKHISENDFNYMCSDCGNKFVNKTRLKDHINWEHLKNYIHRCSDCKKVFKTRTSLYLHRQMVHKEMSDNHLCDHCGKRFPSQARLHYHITALHNKETPYKCTTCSARFSWHSCLTRHVRTIHSKEKTSGLNKR